MTDVDWSSIEKQLFDWKNPFLTGEALKVGILFNSTETTQGSTVNRKRKTGNSGIPAQVHSALGGSNQLKYVNILQ
jgi:hypothetical protein